MSMALCDRDYPFVGSEEWYSPWGNGLRIFDSRWFEGPYVVASALSLDQSDSMANEIILMSFEHQSLGGLSPRTQWYQRLSFVGHHHASETVTSQLNQDDGQNSSRLHV
jgi:hypothetical protein